MVRLVEMDKSVTIFKQMEESTGPVILINKFNVDPQEVNQFLKAWASDAEIMKRQPGFISTQLHRGIAGSCVFINYAIWESSELFKRAFDNPEFQNKLTAYPPTTEASPHLLTKVHVQGICVN
jgi:heme-degrading monooxygenase HmoA